MRSECGTRPSMMCVRFTPPASAVMQQAMQWQELHGKVAGFASKVPAHALRIGSVDSMNNHILPPLFQALRENEPPVFCEVSTSNSAVLYHKIESREVDVAFVLQELHFPYVAAKPFTRERMLVLRTGRDNLPEEVRAEDLEPRFELRFPWASPYQLWHDRVWPFWTGRGRDGSGSSPRTASTAAPRVWWCRRKRLSYIRE